MDIRSHFPALQRVHRGRPVAYFDAPGGTQVPRAVAEAMNDYLFHHNANTHWAYPTSEETDAILFAAREACADLLNARISEIMTRSVFTCLPTDSVDSLAATMTEPEGAEGTGPTAARTNGASVSAIVTAETSVHNLIPVSKGQSGLA